MISEPWGPEIQGQTALSDEDYAHLRPFWVANRADLNLAEAQNINTAQNFYLNRRGTAAHLLDDLEVREMHARMFGSVWTWAGRYRTKNLNLGVDHVEVAQGVRSLMDSARALALHSLGTLGHFFNMLDVDIDMMKRKPELCAREGRRVS